VNRACFIALEVGIGNFEIGNGGTEDVVTADIGKLTKYLLCPPVSLRWRRSL
jgi:hypothetical protein